MEGDHWVSCTRDPGMLGHIASVLPGGPAELGTHRQSGIHLFHPHHHITETPHRGPVSTLRRRWYKMSKDTFHINKQLLWLITNQRSPSQVHYPIVMAQKRWLATGLARCFQDIKLPQPTKDLNEQN